jgi:hypothetical protein
VSDVHEQAIAAKEHEVAVILDDVVTAFVDETMMVSAKQHEIVEFRFTTIGPVVNVVGVDETGVRAARETATPVTTLQCAIDCGGNDTRFAADIQRFAVFGTTAQSHVMRRTVSAANTGPSCTCGGSSGFTGPYSGNDSAEAWMTT